MIRRSVRVPRCPLWGLALFIACAGDGTDGPGAPPPETHTVEIREMEFHPAELRVRAGDTVVWINRDFVPHTATAPDSTWTSPPLARGERWSMVAPAPDIGRYICAFHPVMEAHLIVHPPTSVEEIP